MSRGITGTELERRPLPVQDRFRSPESLLASLFSQKEDAPNHILLTGPRAAGKTAWCLELAALARDRRVSLTGLVSPPVFENGQKSGIDLQDLASGERRRLANHRRIRAQERVDIGTFPSTDDWQFDPDVLTWGNGILERLSECDLFILDEVGPLEFDRGQGLQAGLQQIDARCYRLSVVVVRPALIPRALERWPWAKILPIASGREVAWR